MMVRIVPVRINTTEMARGGVSAKMKKYTSTGLIWMGTCATGMMLLAWAYLKAIWFCYVWMDNGTYWMLKVARIRCVLSSWFTPSNFANE